MNRQTILFQLWKIVRISTSILIQFSDEIFHSLPIFGFVLHWWNFSPSQPERIERKNIHSINEVIIPESNRSTTSKSNLFNRETRKRDEIFLPAFGRNSAELEREFYQFQTLSKPRKSLLVIKCAAAFSAFCALKWFQ